MEKGDIYILTINKQSPFKCKVLEVTRCTFLLQNIDNNTHIPFRVTHEQFHKSYQIVELIYKEKS